jgi:hypothetical protein
MTLFLGPFNDDITKFYCISQFVPTLLYWIVFIKIQKCSGINVPIFGRSMSKQTYLFVLEINISWRKEKLHVYILNMYLTHNIALAQGKDKH